MLFTDSGETMAATLSRLLGLLEFSGKTSIVTETSLLQSMMPTIGGLAINQLHDGTLTPYAKARLAAGKSHKTINLGLGVVRRILKLASTKWRDENGNTWLEHAPLITIPSGTPASRRRILTV